MNRKQGLFTALMVAAILVLTAAGAAGQGVPAAPIAPPPRNPLVELTVGLAWPIAALLIAWIFRKPIGEFMSALGSRVTKFSAFQVEVELPPATATTTTPLLDDIRTATTAAAINDSARALLEQVQAGGPADFSLIQLGGGDEWLTSRLFIAVVLMERMRGVKVFVFVERSPTTERRFVAVASARYLRWVLARRYPWLEVAWQNALHTTVFPSADPQTLLLSQSVITSDTGALEASNARRIVSAFIGSLQRQPQSHAEWVVLPGGTTQERAAWVTRELITSLLPQEALDAWANVLRDAPRSQRTRAVLRRAGPFVALVDDDRGFVRLVNRQALLEEIAASQGEEPERGT